MKPPSYWRDKQRNSAGGMVIVLSDDLIEQIQADAHNSAIDNARWQLIETAPKNSAFLAAIKTDNGYTFEICELNEYGKVRNTQESESLFCRSWYCEATHWQPLPTPPK